MNGLLETFKENLDGKKKNVDESKGLWAEFALQTKQVFLNFFLILINNYLDFFLTSEELPTEFDFNQFGAAEVFCFREYLNVFGKDAAGFMDSFASKTMMFNKFIEDTFRILYKIQHDPSIKIDSQKDEISAFISMLHKLQERKAHPAPSPKDPKEISPHAQTQETVSFEFTLVESEQNRIIQDSFKVFKNVNISSHSLIIFPSLEESHC